jgi:hypothetical protein
MKIIRPHPTEPLRTNYASAIYGLIVSMAVIATASQDDGLSAGEIGFWAVATSFVFFLAHVYSHIVAAGIVRPRDARVEVKAVARREWPMVQGAMIPAVVMFMGALGIFGEDQASYIAVWTGVTALFLAGLLIGTRNELSWGGRLFIASVNATLGFIIMALKIFVH